FDAGIEGMASTCHTEVLGHREWSGRTDSTGLALALSELTLELGPDLLAESDDLPDHPVDGLHDRLRQGLEELLDLLGDTADAQNRGQPPDQPRNRFGRRFLDQCWSPAGATAGDRDDGIQYRVDELDDLCAALDDERDDVDDHLAGFDERRRGVEQADD